MPGSALHLVEPLQHSIRQSTIDLILYIVTFDIVLDLWLRQRHSVPFQKDFEPLFSSHYWFLPCGPMIRDTAAKIVP